MSTKLYVSTSQFDLIKLSNSTDAKGFQKSKLTSVLLLDKNSLRYRLQAFPSYLNNWFLSSVFVYVGSMENFKCYFPRIHHRRVQCNFVDNVANMPQNCKQDLRLFHSYRDCCFQRNECVVNQFISSISPISINRILVVQSRIQITWHQVNII